MRESRSIKTLDTNLEPRYSLYEHRRAMVVNRFWSESWFTCQLYEFDGYCTQNSKYCYYKTATIIESVSSWVILRSINISNKEVIDIIQAAKRSHWIHVDAIVLRLSWNIRKMQIAKDFRYRASQCPYFDVICMVFDCWFRRHGCATYSNICTSYHTWKAVEICVFNKYAPHNLIYFQIKLKTRHGWLPSD